MRQLNESEIIAFVKAYSREPQQAIFAAWLEGAPSKEAIQSLADRAPDRWAQGAAILSSLAGFNPKLEVQGSVVHRIDNLSDSQLEAQIIALQLDTGHASLLDIQSNGHTLESPANPPVSEQ